MTPATPLHELRGSRVLLRAMREDDITPAHVAWLNDPEVVRYSKQRFVRHTTESCLQYLHSFGGSAHLYASIRLLSVDEPAGTLTVHRSLHHGTADIGILLGERRLWGQGLGLEAFNTVSDWLANQPGMRKLTCGTLAGNHGMLGVAQSAGYAREAVRVGQELVDGRPTDVVLFARFVDTAPA